MKSVVFWSDLRLDPSKPWGIFENPVGSPTGPRAGAEAGLRFEAPNGGRSGGPSVLWVPEWFFEKLR